MGPLLADTNVPVVFYGINANPRKYFKDRKIPDHMTGVLERVPIYAILRIIKPLLPNAKNILMLFDNSSTTDAIIETTLAGKNHISIGHFTLHSKIVDRFQEWNSEIIHAHEKYDAIYLATFFTIKDDTGNTIDNLDVLKWSSKHTKIPLFGSQAFMVADDGVMGAFIIEGEKHGQMAADMAAQIMENGKIPLYRMHKESKLILNQTQLSRFHVILPKDIKNVSIVN